MRVLIIEDSDVDFWLIERALGHGFTLSRSSSLEGGVAHAATTPVDLIILDLSVEDSAGYETFEKAHAALPRLPILVLSGLDDEDLALRAVSNGAQDYILKSKLLGCSLDRIARYAVERRKAEDNARHAERQFRLLFENLPTAAYTCDADGLITYCNKKAIELWGRAPKLNDPSERFTGSSKAFTAAGVPIPKEQSLMGQALRERKAFGGAEYIIEVVGGRRRNVLANATPVFDDRGELQGGISVLVDITAQREAERQLRESERFARATVDSIGAKIAVLDDQGIITAVNKAWRRSAEQNGQSCGGLGVGANYLRVCDGVQNDEEEIAGRTAAGIRSILRGELREFELEYPCHSPTEERWYVLRATPFEGDGPRRVVVLHEDITERKVAARLASEQRGLRDAVAGMEQVLGVVGHELRTPLAAMRAMSEFLTTDGARNNPEADHFLQSISDEVDRMSDTVNNLLEAARLNSGRARWNWSDVDLGAIIDDALGSIRPLIDATRIEVASRIDPSAAFMLGDAEALRRLLINLLSNARKHTTQGRIEVSNRHYTDAEGTWIELAVSDTGHGIPAPLAAKLGHAFALNSGIVGANHVSGTGLGLAICKEIAVAHGGKLLIESTEGKGTRVTARMRGDLPEALSGDTVQQTPLTEAAA